MTTRKIKIARMTAVAQQSEEGWTTAKMAIENGCTESQVKHDLAKLGHPSYEQRERTFRRKGRLIAVKRLRDQGWPLEKIATECFVSRETVRKDLLTLGESTESGYVRQKNSGVKDNIETMLKAGSDPVHVAATTGKSLRFVRDVARDRKVPYVLLKPLHAVKYPKSMILSLLRREKVIMGRLPMMKDFMGHSPGRPSLSVIVNRFGSWNAAINEAFHTQRGPHDRPYKYESSRFNRENGKSDV
jgi:lambda repressor-like predicted transcriptional regulator